MKSETTKAVLASFRELDPRGIWKAAGPAPGSPAADAVRVALAFGEIARGNDGAAARLLSEIEGDGTSPTGDIAFVRGFLLAETGSLEEAAATLESAFDDPSATHPSRLRLSAAEIRIRLGQWAEARAALLPLLGPPGNEDTLEAHLLTLEMLVRSRAPREAIIELASVADALAERGFRLRDGRTTLSVLETMSELKVEGLPERIAQTHADLIETIETTDAEELAYLVAAGERFKSGAMVRAAARNFELLDLAWPGDAEVAAFQFAQHEEFDAARLVIERGFPAAEIAARADLWGPLLLACYHGGEWVRALALLDAHDREIQGSRVEASSRLIRAVCLLHTGDASAAAAAFGDLPPAWRSEALPHEAACMPMALARAGRTGEVRGEVDRWLAGEARTEERAHYLNTLFNDAVARHDAMLFRELVAVVMELPEPGLGMRLWMLADLAMRWDMPAGAEAVAVALDESGECERADFWRVVAALHPHSPRAIGLEAASAALEALGAGADQFLASEATLERARLLARMGIVRDARLLAEQAAMMPALRRAHIAWELAARLCEPESPDAARARESARRAALLPGAPPEAHYAREYERMTFFEEESAEGVRRLLAEARARAPKSSEIQRLERRLAVLERATGAT